ncbi:hypothetical protein TC_0374 [Chlamydia muridarum str. Nigg]|uniref:Uncharacterized protein n=1 Tax=Chlamydia muridarum (strain MoPn / Nigg) TaxID=243161 RepID=Q9PKT8_CHLMU|nr:hypothetical protein TC_0374 [Chlamydia muridarum str. Nigg]
MNVVCVKSLVSYSSFLQNQEDFSLYICSSFILI